jgi:hypothetical protein
MILRHRVALNGAQLDELDERIIVSGIDEQAGRETLNAVSRFGGSGQRVTTRHRDSLDVVVRFGLRIKPRDMESREELFEKVVAWAAGGGWLTINYKPDRRLYVTCAQLPAAGDMAEWTKEYAITFRAFGVPYWQQETPVVTSVASTRQATRTLKVVGSAETVLDVAFTNLSGMEIASASVSAGASHFELENLRLGADEMLLIDHTEDGLLRIRIQAADGAWRSALGCRTQESSDDLTVSPGDVTVTFTAQRAGRLVLSCSGRFA